ncbi:MAG: alpha/beta fold hydrolase [Alphaproteobacteria bacterium]|nr:alpha/beta fold hydrolase [Alphaproteobacteria bacterium]MBV8413068.1 alpha/beta fold hydrolase [Alphaproteobacteria bacterium]
MIDAHETFGGTWPFAPHFLDGKGIRMHYVDEGEGEPIVCLHGEPTWGYLYRRFIPPLSRTHRVIVPDHMGFGKSETPQDRPYTLRSHVENLAGLIEALDLNGITFVIQDWGGPIGAAYTLRHPERVKRLFLLNTLTGYGRASPAALTPWFKFIKKHHDAGTLHEVLGHLDVNVLSIMKIIGFENSAAIDDNWLAAYGAPFPTAQDCIGAIEFPLDALLGRILPYVREGFPLVGNLKSKPAMLAVGLKDKAIAPDVQMADFRNLWPDRPIVPLPHAGHFSQEDAPETIVALIQAFLQVN